MVESATTKEGLDAVRDHLIANIDEVSVGTGDSTPKRSDTTLETEVARGSASNDATGTGELESTYRLGAGEANNEDITELMLHIDGDSFTRVVFGDTPKSDGFEIEFETVVEARNP